MKHLSYYIIAVLVVLGNVLWAQGDEVLFSQKGGIYSTAFPVALSCQHPNHHIRYTLNGSTPDSGSLLYTDALPLDNTMVSSSDIYKIQISPSDEAFYPETVMKAIVIRAAVFDESEKRVSPVVTQSYFIRSLGCVSHDLPVVSICADSLSLFSADTGILVPGVYWDTENPDWTGNYYQSGKSWERRVNVEYYATGNEGFNQQAGLRTHGGNGRRLTQKGLKIYAREEYGTKRFKYNIFDDCDISSFKHLVLKPFMSAWTTSGLQNHLSYLMARNLNLDILDSRPVVLFLNGEYWGIYYFQEKPDERYLEDHYDIDPDDANIIGNWFGQIEEGSNIGFMELMDFVSATDFSDADNYRQLTDLIDIDNFIDYQILEIFASNADWPANNMRCWQTAGRKWRWFFYDCDACFGNPAYYFYNIALDESDQFWPSNATSTLLFRSLLKNETFVRQFLARLMAINSDSLDYRNTLPCLATAMAMIHGEISNQVERFNFPKSISDWENSCRNIDHFLQDRKQELASQTNILFNLSGKRNNLVCFPNPVKGENICVRFDSDQDTPGEITIHDMTGKCVFTEQIDMKAGTMRVIIAPNLPQGVYVLHVGHQSAKIVIL